MLRSFVYISCTCLSSGLECNSLFVEPWGWDERGSEQSIWLSRGWAQYLHVLQVGSGGTPGLITDDSDTF